MKEDILEQLVDEYLQHKGYFTIHNVKFKPSKDHPDYSYKQDSVHSDIDVVGFNPTLSGPEKVLAVSCKSWQNGFDPINKIHQIENQKISSGREAWRGFRELTKDKWSAAFHDKIYEITNSKEFMYITAVTFLKSDSTEWENYKPFQASMRGNPIKVLTLNTMLDEIYPSIDQTLAASSVGRFVQLIKASKWIEKKGQHNG